MDGSAGRYGPKMRALPTDMMRAFVEQYLTQGTEDATAAAQAAGYSVNSRNALRVQAHRLVHDERVQAALREEAERRLTAGLPLAVNALMDVVRDKAHRDHVKAVQHLLALGGLTAKQEHKVVVEHTSEEMRLRIAQLAEFLEIDATRLLGGAVIDAEPVVDAE